MTERTLNAQGSGLDEWGVQALRDELSQRVLELEELSLQVRHLQQDLEVKEEFIRSLGSGTRGSQVRRRPPRAVSEVVPPMRVAAPLIAVWRYAVGVRNFASENGYRAALNRAVRFLRPDKPHGD